MKKILFILITTMLVFVGCAEEKTTQSNENETISVNDSTNSEVDESMINSENKVTDNYIDEYSDGIIASMSAEELIQKLSMLNENTTMSDVVDIFGQAPYLPMSVSADVYYYYSGDIQINIWGSTDGAPIYRVEVIYDGAMFVVELQDSFIVQE